ncbi:MAG: (2Fe-2S)-binding protein [bacterium]
MIDVVVCSCHALTEQRIRAEIERGATSLGELARRCGAGDDCGSCKPELSALLAGSSPSHPRFTPDKMWRDDESSGRRQPRNAHDRESRRRSP